jgi:hypothetical protein
LPMNARSPPPPPHLSQSTAAGTSQDHEPHRIMEWNGLQKTTQDHGMEWATNTGDGSACNLVAANLIRTGFESSLGSTLANDKDDVAMSTVSELKAIHDQASIS